QRAGSCPNRTEKIRFPCTPHNSCSRLPVLRPGRVLSQRSLAGFGLDRVVVCYRDFTRAITSWIIAFSGQLNPSYQIQRMINGTHVVIYSKNPEADRVFFRDVLKFPSLDAGHGWLIFAMPPLEAAFHDSENNDKHELYLMCDDIAATLKDLTA